MPTSIGSPIHPLNSSFSFINDRNESKQARFSFISITHYLNPLYSLAQRIYSVSITIFSYIVHSIQCLWDHLIMFNDQDCLVELSPANDLTKDPIAPSTNTPPAETSDLPPANFHLRHLFQTILPSNLAIITLEPPTKLAPLEERKSISSFYFPSYQVYESHLFAFAKKLAQENRLDNYLNCYLSFKQLQKDSTEELPSTSIAKEKTISTLNQNEEKALSQLVAIVQLLRTNPLSLQLGHIKALGIFLEKCIPSIKRASSDNEIYLLLLEHFELYELLQNALNKWVEEFNTKLSLLCSSQDSSEGLTHFSYLSHLFHACNGLLEDSFLLTIRQQSLIELEPPKTFYETKKFAKIKLTTKLVTLLLKIREALKQNLESNVNQELIALKKLCNLLEIDTFSSISFIKDLHRLFDLPYSNELLMKNWNSYTLEINYQIILKKLENKELLSPPTHLTPAGTFLCMGNIRNFGHSCYFDCIIWMFAQSSSFDSLLTSSIEDQKNDKKNHVANLFRNQLLAVINNLRQNNPDSQSESYIDQTDLIHLHQLAQFLGWPFPIGEQTDPSEFYKFCFNIFNAKAEKHAFQIDSVDELLWTHPNGNPMKIVRNNSSEYSIELPIRKNTSIQQLFDEYLATETIEDYKADDTYTVNIKKQHFLVGSAPKTLMLQQNRFTFSTENYQGQRMNEPTYVFDPKTLRAELMIPFSEDSDKLNNGKLFQYTLKSIICHESSSMHSGHYTFYTTIKWEQDTHWIKYNDLAPIQLVSLQEVIFEVNHNGYTLIYDLVENDSLESFPLNTPTTSSILQDKTQVPLSLEEESIFFGFDNF